MDMPARGSVTVPYCILCTVLHVCAKTKVRATPTRVKTLQFVFGTDVRAEGEAGQATEARQAHGRGRLVGHDGSDLRMYGSFSFVAEK